MLSHNSKHAQLRISYSSEAHICKRLSSQNVKWIDVVCCSWHLNEELVFLYQARECLEKSLCLVIHIQMLKLVESVNFQRIIRIIIIIIIIIIIYGATTDSGSSSLNVKQQRLLHSCCVVSISKLLTHAGMYKQTGFCTMSSQMFVDN